MVGKRADHNHHVSVARRRGQEEAEPVHVVVRIVELLDLVKTGAAIAGVDYENLDRAPKGCAESIFLVILTIKSYRPFVSARPVDWVVGAAHAAEAVDTSSQMDSDAVRRHFKRISWTARHYRLRQFRREFCSGW